MDKELAITIQELKEKFSEISKKGYIKGIYNNLSSIVWKVLWKIDT